MKCSLIGLSSKLLARRADQRRITFIPIDKRSRDKGIQRRILGNSRKFDEAILGPSFRRPQKYEL